MPIAEIVKLDCDINKCRCNNSNCDGNDGGYNSNNVVNSIHDRTDDKMR